MTRCWSKWVRARSTAAADMADRRSGSPSRPEMAPASASGERTGTSTPVTPSSTTCRQPRMSVATMGSPLAAASMAERGNPSRCDART